MRDERGVSESVAWAVLAPLVLVLVLGIVQGAVWAHGRTVASNAAVAAAEEASVLGGSGVPGAVAAGESLARGGGLADVSVRVVPGPDAVTAVVTGRTVTFFDLGQSRLEARATRPLERVTTP